MPHKLLVVVGRRSQFFPYLDLSSGCLNVLHSVVAGFTQSEWSKNGQGGSHDLSWPSIAVILLRLHNSLLAKKVSPIRHGSELQRSVHEHQKERVTEDHLAGWQPDTGLPAMCLGMHLLLFILLCLHCVSYIYRCKPFDNSWKFSVINSSNTVSTAFSSLVF